METPEALVAHNVAELREERRHTVRSLSALLGKLGRPILPSGITKIENQDRRVDVGDLIALALALGVTPNRLMLPVHDLRSEVALTPTIKTNQFHAWPWADGKESLQQADMAVFGERPTAQATEDLVRHSRPYDERIRDQHTAVQVARHVFSRINDVLIAKEFGEQLLEGNPRASLRRALNRLIAEVDDLLGDDDGER